MDAWRVIEVQPSQPNGKACLKLFIFDKSFQLATIILIKGQGEFLLVFHTLAIYVDQEGRKSRDREIMYPAVPTHISKSISFRFICVRVSPI